jgi:hemin uptake protein HemP
LDREQHNRTGTPGDAPTPRRTLPEVDVKTITAGGREAVILHQGERYRLRITANDKLILTK